MLATAAGILQNAQLQIDAVRFQDKHQEKKFPGLSH
jgi:hypothetical protein